MPLIWNLRRWLAVEREIYRPSELQSVLAKKGGIILSLPAITALLKGSPQAVRFQTIQALCNALECELADFCRVVPDSHAEREAKQQAMGEGPVRPYARSRKKATDGNPFPSALDYLPSKKDS